MSAKTMEPYGRALLDFFHGALQPHQDQDRKPGRGPFSMKNQDVYLRSIRSAYPDLDIASAGFNAQGQNSDVVVVNDEFIFRFPKYAHVIEDLRTETAILEAVRGRVPLPVPDPIFVCLERPVGQAFAAYCLIPGEPLWWDTFRAIENREVVRRLADQVAGFLRALHSIPVDSLGIELPLHDTYAEGVDIYARIREKLFGLMRPDARAWATEHFEGFLARASNFAGEPVLKHGDFGPSNILFDNGRQRVSGIIDFGGSGLGDPAYDFAGLLSGYGEGFVEQCARAYPEVEGFMGRIRFYRGTFALLEALFGIENGDQDALRAGLAQYV
jgi:aminoglycoside 2''-phosphotransferase